MSETAAATAEDSPPKKGGLNMMGLLVLGVACAATSFASVYLLAPAPTVAVAATSDDAAEADYAESEKASEEKITYTYTPVQEILVTVGNAPATRYLKMQLSLATDKADAKTIKSNETALIDAFLLYLRSVNVDDFEDPAFYKHMREQLGRRADLVLGDGVAKGVLITEFLLR
ncbi:MAG: flagellar basal body-associated FliL family protein [Pseudomonadota bacterium]